MQRLSEIQAAIRAEGLAGWLLYEFRGLNPIALDVLGISAARSGSRRWACFIPAQGEPRWLVHAIELLDQNHSHGFAYAVEPAVGQLGEDDLLFLRTLLNLKYHDESSSEQIASSLERSVAWVRTTLCRVRQQLRECVERKLKAEPS